MLRFEHPPNSPWKRLEMNQTIPLEHIPEQDGRIGTRS